MKICPNCNFSLRDIADVCFNCGLQLETTNVKVDIREDTKNDKTVDHPVQTRVVIPRQDMKPCPNPDCKLLISIHATSCVCGYQSVGKEEPQRLAERANLASDFEQAGIPGVIYGYIGLLLACIAVLYIGMSTGRHFSLRPNLGSGFPKIFLSGIVVVGVLNYLFITHRSNMCRILLIIFTFPIGLILLDPSVSKYTAFRDNAG